MLSSKNHSSWSSPMITVMSGLTARSVVDSSSRAFWQAHRAAIRRPDFFGLSGEEREVLAEQEAGRALAGSLGFHAGGPVHEEIAADDRQPHAAVLRRITHHALGLAAAHHALGILE